MDSASLKESATDAIKYWEPRRILYNVVLLTVVLLYFVIGLPHSKQLLNLNFVLLVFLLAVMANVAYCAAYIVDVFAQSSGVREQWLKYRWVLLAVGILFASVLTRFFALGLFQIPD